VTVDPGERNIELVRRLNEVFDRNDFVSLRDALESSDTVALTSGDLGELSREMAEIIDEDVEVEFLISSPLVEGRRFVGFQGWIELWRQWLSAWEVYSLEASNYESIGNCVVADVIHRGRGRTSGLEVELMQAQLWTLREGKVVRNRIFDERTEAIQAIEEDV
jgi:ketosteroid isomerase-like protein